MSAQITFMVLSFFFNIKLIRMEINTLTAVY